MPTQMQTLYTGRSGHLAVMAVFLQRGYNAAVPEVDRGDDIFVVEDSTGNLSRVQVKAATSRGKKRHHAQYQLSMAQLQKKHTPELHYVFAIHYEALWRDFVVISRDELNTLRGQHGLGAVREGKLYLGFSFGAADVLCNKVDFQAFRNNWRAWPVLVH